MDNNKTAQQELDELLITLDNAGHEALRDIISVIPCTVAAFSKIAEKLPADTRSKYAAQIKQLTKLNALLDLAHDAPQQQQQITGNGNGKASKKAEEDEETRKTFYVQKFTNGTLVEAVIVAGLPYFLHIENDEVRLIQSKELPAMILKPSEVTSYLNKPYEFASIEEINEYINRAKLLTLDDLYKKVKAIWQKYIDADNDHIVICAADTIFTYFQDKLGLTHYLGFIGDNGSGKTNNLRVLQNLAYRAYFDTSITPANMYQFMGSIEEGQGIILEDEADNIDQNEEKMRVYKVGYTKGTRISRIDTTFGRKQQGFWTYCFKAISAERSPDNVKGKGFNERTFYLQCNPGLPKHDILEVINHDNEPELKALYDELVDTRKLLLIYRMLHYNETIHQVKLTIKNREKQLTESVIRLFQKTEALKEILPTLQNLLAQKRDRKLNTLEAKVFQIVQKLSPTCNYQVSNAAIWEAIKEEIPGNEIEKRPQSYETEAYGIISKRQISQIITDRFCAVQKRDKERTFIFSQDKVQRLARVYNISDKIEILNPTLQTLPTLLDNISQQKQPDQTGKNERKQAQNKDENSPKNHDIGTVEVSKVSKVSKVSPSITKADTKTAKTNMIKCPICDSKFATVKLVVQHSINVHPRRPIVAMLHEQGYNVDDV